MPVSESVKTHKILVLDKAAPVHFIGVGGVGMSALAKILLESGFKVSGSDAKASAYTQMLEKLGGKIFIGHAAENLPDKSVVVVSTAITDTNPEVEEARKKGLLLYHRSDLLAAILKQYPKAIGLTGTHGKTSMTGMTGLVLEAGGLDPTIIAGGKIPGLNANSKTGKSDYAVAELDESDGTVVQYQPKFSVIANLELDHADHFGGLDAIKQTFNQYLSALPSDHIVLFNMDCPVTKELYEVHRNRIIALQIYPTTQRETIDASVYTLRNTMLHLEGGYQADLFEGERQIGTIWLQVPGLHNLANAMFAAVIGHKLEIPFDKIRRALENFTGMGRRFEKVGTYQGARVVDDYAHHPTEVAATLKAAREYNKYGGGRVIAVFQPHRYSRLQALWKEFLEAFEDADEVILVDAYSAGEAPIEGVTSKAFIKELDHPAKDYWPSSDWKLVAEGLKKILTTGDLLITMGAGDITQLGRTLVEAP